jgi:hypothetical protein
VACASIADPYVLLKMVDGSVQLLIGGNAYPLVKHELLSLLFVFYLSKLRSNFKILVHQYILIACNLSYCQVVWRK